MAKTVRINGSTYTDVPAFQSPLASGGGNATFYETSGANATAADVLDGKIVYGANGEVVGSMPSNGAVGGTISTKNGTVTIPAGNTTGGSVSLAPSAVTDLLAQNILSGKTVLGVAGSLTTATITQDSTTKILSIS